jgi:hypothetical protein
MSTRSISDYAGRGLLAARPVSPPVVSTGTAFYYATDTAQLFVWSGSGWVNAGAPPGPSILQQAQAGVASAATGVTLPGAPTPGNLMICIFHNVGTLSVNAATGWQRIGVGGATGNNINFYARWVLAGDTAAQVPATGTAAGNYFIYEIENASAPNIQNVIQTGSVTTAARAFDIDAYLGILPSTGLLFAVSARATLVANATSVTGAFTTLNEAINTGSGAMTTQIIRGNVTKLTNVDFTVNYAGSAATGIGWIVVV